MSHSDSVEAYSRSLWQELKMIIKDNKNTILQNGKYKTLLWQTK